MSSGTPPLAEIATEIATEVATETATETETAVPGAVESVAGLATAPATCGDPLQTLSCLLRTVEDLNDAPDLATGLEGVAADLHHQVPFDTFAVLLLDDLGQELRFCFAEGLEEQVVEHWRFGLGQGLVGTAAAEGEPLVIGDVRDDPRYIAADRDLRSEAAIPLVAKNRTIGVLDVGSYQIDFFTIEHVRFLQLIAGHLGTAMENRQLYAAQRRQAQLLSMLHEASRELTSILDRRELLRRVGELVRRQVACNDFTVLLWDEDSQLLDPVHTAHFDRAPGDFAPMRLGQGLCGTAAALRQSLRVPNVRLDPRYEDCGRSDVRSELAVPMLFKERLVGVLDLQSDRFNAFSSDDEQFVATLASSVAIALENARLYERLRAEERKMAHDLHTARGIQRYLLPRKTPWVPGLQIATAYHPARQLGGDFYEFLAYGDQKTAIAVGDVAGKGTAAALYGSLVLGMLRGHAAESCDSPKAVLGYLNDELRQLGIDRRFVAMTFAVFDGCSKLTVTNAGLPYPHLLRGGRIREIEIAGVPVGAMAETTYEQAELDLEEGDVLVFASDGIEELIDAHGEIFGTERFEATLREHAGASAHDIARGVMTAAKRFLGEDEEPSDDQTIVVLKVTGRC